jgi:hypothetical protein
MSRQALASLAIWVCSGHSPHRPCSADAQGHRLGHGQIHRHQISSLLEIKLASQATCFSHGQVCHRQCLSENDIDLWRSHISTIIAGVPEDYILFFGVNSNN